MRKNTNDIYAYHKLSDSERKKIKYVAYVRKSTESEERQALSRDAQWNAIQSRFSNLNIDVVHDANGKLGESMSAAKPGRPVFQKMLKDIEKGKYQGVVAWHPDRISRNPKDAGDFMWLLQSGKIEDLLFCSYEFSCTPDGIEQLQSCLSQAQKYSGKLSIDVRRGNHEKRKQGYYPSHPPVGYMHDQTTKTIIPDPKRFNLIQRAFKLILTGEYSARQVCDIANQQWGFQTKTGRPLAYQTFNKALHNPFCAGFFYDLHTGEEFQGKHIPMITREEFELIQGILAGRGLPQNTPGQCFALSGILRCGHCGYNITAERKHKKQKNGNQHDYTYYHCTHKSKEINCRQPSVEEKELFRQIMELVGTYSLPPELSRWNERAIKDLISRETAGIQPICRSREEKIKELNNKLDRAYKFLDKGTISEEMYQKQAADIETQIKQIEAEVEGDKNEQEDVNKIIESTLVRLTNADDKFKAGSLDDKRKIISAIGSNPTLTDKKLSLNVYFWLQPIAKAKEKLTENKELARTPHQQMKNTSEEGIYHLWLGMRDSNPRMPGPEPGALPLGESPRREEKESLLSFSERRQGLFHEVKSSPRNAGNCFT